MSGTLAESCHPERSEGAEVREMPETSPPSLRSG